MTLYEGKFNRSFWSCLTSIFTKLSPDISREKGEDDADVEDDPRHHQEDVAHAETGLHQAVYPFLGENNH